MKPRLRWWFGGQEASGFGELVCFFGPGVVELALADEREGVVHLIFNNFYYCLVVGKSIL